MKQLSIAAANLCLGAILSYGQAPRCDLTNYRPQPGLAATTTAYGVEFVWDGERGQPLRAVFTIRAGNPIVHELAARKGAAWILLGRDLTPEYDVVSGKRRLSEQQMAPLRKLPSGLTPEVIEREKWNAFWDAPLMIPGNPGGSDDLPRKPEEIRRAPAVIMPAPAK